MAARDYKKLYNELKVTHEATTERLDTLQETHTNLMSKYSRLDDEFTKAVNANKNQQMMIFEQRGIIGFLETKMTALAEQMKDY